MATPCHTSIAIQISSQAVPISGDHERRASQVGLLTGAEDEGQVGVTTTVTTDAPASAVTSAVEKQAGEDAEAALDKHQGIRMTGIVKMINIVPSHKKKNLYST
jgi:hypothetical protein